MPFLFSNWILVAIFAYFLHAGNVIMDKILLKEHHISNPFSYAFYGGIWGGLACILIPFASFFVPSVSVLLLAFLSGGASIAALMFFYSAMKEGEPSRISTLLGGLSPVFVFFLRSALLLHMFRHALFLIRHRSLPDSFGLVSGHVWPRSYFCSIPRFAKTFFHGLRVEVRIRRDCSSQINF